MKTDLTIYLMKLIMYYKYYYFLVYIWSKLEVFNYLGSENDIFRGRWTINIPEKVNRTSSSVHDLILQKERKKSIENVI